MPIGFLCGHHLHHPLAGFLRSVPAFNLIANTAIFYFAARLYLLPLVSRLRAQQILVPILLLHSTRHLGMMFRREAPFIQACPWSSPIRQGSEI